MSTANNANDSQPSSLYPDSPVSTSSSLSVDSRPSPSSPRLPELAHFTPLDLEYTGLMGDWAPSPPSSPSARSAIVFKSPSLQSSIGPHLDNHCLPQTEETEIALVSVNSNSKTTISVMGTTVAPLRTGIIRSTRPPVLPLASSALSSFSTLRHSTPTLPSPRIHPSPDTPPPCTPPRRSYDGSARECQPLIARRSSTGTFGAARDGRDHDLLVDTPSSSTSGSPPSARRRTPATSSPSTPGAAAQRRRDSGHTDPARADRYVSGNNAISTIPIKSPPSVGTPLPRGVEETPEDEERVVTGAANDMARKGNVDPLVASIDCEVKVDVAQRRVSGCELPYTLGQVMDFSAFEVQFFPAQSSAGLPSAQSPPPTINPRTTSLKVDAAASMPNAKDEVAVSGQDISADDALELSHDRQPGRESDSITKREELKNQLSEQGYVPLPERVEEISLPPTQPTDKAKRHSHQLSLSSVASRDGSQPRVSCGDSESVTSATALLPSATITSSKHVSSPAPLVFAAPDARDRSGVSQSLGSRSDLSPERKAQLVRRTRKLERVLGEPLPEKHIEQFVIEPSLSTTNIMTKLEENVWPTTPVTTAPPEWERADVVPRCDRVPKEELEEEAESPAQPVQRLAHQRSRSGLALSRVRSLIGGRDVAAPAKLVVSLTREVHTIETQVRSHPMMRHSVNRDEQHPQPLTPDTPLSSKTVSTIETPEEASRRQRRQQLAKLQRLLGTTVPPHALRNGDDDLMPRCTPQLPGAHRNASESSLSIHSGASGVSATEAGRGRLAARLLRTVHVVQHGRSSFAGGTTMERKLSFDIAPLSPPLAAPAFNDENTMTRSEKAVARKRASKLEQVFGQAPPRDLFLPIRRRDGDKDDGIIAESVITDLTPSARDKENNGPYGSSVTRSTCVGGANARASCAGSSSKGHAAGLTSDDPLVPDLAEVTPTPAFAGYRQSIQSLIWLVENDQGRLASIIDEIADLDESRSSRTTTPVPAHGRRASLSSIEGQFGQFGQVGRCMSPTNVTYAATAGRVTSAATGAGVDGARSPTSPRRPLSPRSPRSPMALFHSLSRVTGLNALSRVAPDSPTTPEPLTPQQSAHALARKRTRKLSAFFGERVDPIHAHGDGPKHRAYAHNTAEHRPAAQAPAPARSHRAGATGNPTRSSTLGFVLSGLSTGPEMSTGPPPARPSTMAIPPRPAAARRRETFDGVLGELWRNIQSEAAQGRLRSTEFVNLCELWGRLGRERAQSTAWAEL